MVFAESSVRKKRCGHAAQAPVDVYAQSDFAYHATVRWLPDEESHFVARHLSVCAIDSSTGELFADLNVLGSKAIDGRSFGTCIKDERLRPGLEVEFIVRVVGDVMCSENSKKIRIGTKDMSTVGLNSAALLADDGVSLRCLLKSSRMLYGTWEAKYHVGVLRVMYTHGLGLSSIPRLTSGGNHVARRDVLCCNNVMRSILRFAAGYCTPTNAELTWAKRTCQVDDRGRCLQAALRTGIDPNMGSLLYTAVEARNIDATKLLISRGVSITSATFALSIHTGTVEIVNVLIHAGADVNVRTGKRQRTPLMIALRGGNYAKVIALIQGGADIDKPGSKTNCAYGRTALMYAVRRLNKTCIRTLIAAGANVNLSPVPNCVTPLILATLRGDLGICTMLQSAGAHINTAMQNGMTPLYTAAEIGHDSILRFYIKCNAQLNKATNTGMTPLYVATKVGNTQIVKLLCEAGANVNKTTHVNNFTPLYIAIHNRNIQMMKILISNGAKVNTIFEPCGTTPLIQAVHTRDVEAVELLLHSGADKAIANSHGKNAIIIARNQKCPDIIHLLQPKIYLTI